MPEDFEFGLNDVRNLYGDRLFLVSDNDSAPPAVSSPAAPETAVTNETEAKTAPKTAQKTEPKAESKAEPAEPGIVWRPKPTSKVLFIIHQAELKNKELGELLKKIVQSIGIPFEAAGFGIITGPIVDADYAAMPNPFGVIFDHTAQPGDDNPVQREGKEVYFTHRLDLLKDNQDHKRALWENLKIIKPKL